MPRPLFIAFEGIDGSGKSTQVALLAEHLEAAGHRVYRTAEPTTRPIGKMIREIFAGKQEADHKVIAALFAADRLDHLLNSKDGILKKMKEGFTVLTDRYFLSSYAYHSVHMPMDWVIEANRMAKDILKPDVHIYIDAEPEVCMERIRKNRTSTELYETLGNLKQVKEKYQEAILASRDTEQIAIVPSRETPQETAVEVQAALTARGLL